MAAHSKNIFSIDMQEGSQSNYIFTVHVTAQDKSTARKHVLKAYQKEATEPGFRKGHVPLPLVEKKLNSGTLFMAVLEHLINDSIAQILDQYGDKRRIGQIYNLNTEKYNEDMADGQIVFTLDIFPEVKEKNDKWKAVQPKKFDATVSEEDIQTALNQLRSSYASFDDVEKVTTTSLMRVKTQFFDKDDVEVGKGKNQYLGEEELSAFPELHKFFLNKKKGDIISIPYKLASGVKLLNYSGEEAVSYVKCEIIDIKQKVLPEVNQDFIDKVFQKEDHISSPDELIEQIRKTLSSTKQQDSLFDRVDTYLKSVDSSFDLVIPLTLIDEETNNRLHQLGHQLGGEKGLKLYLERMGEDESKKYIETIKQAASTSIHKYFVLRYIAQHLELDIDWTKGQGKGEVEQLLYEKLAQ